MLRRILFLLDFRFKTCLKNPNTTLGQKRDSSYRKQFLPVLEEDISVSVPLFECQVVLGQHDRKHRLVGGFDTKSSAKSPSEQQLSRGVGEIRIHYKPRCLRINSKLAGRGFCRKPCSKLSSIFHLGHKSNSR